jgi:hypothetical protein
MISVSPDNVNWYTYAAGPYGDDVFPTQGYEWSGEQFDDTGNGWTTQATDFTKPVNPTLAPVLGVSGQVTANAMAMYAGSGGGAAVDLNESGFAWIQYVRVNSTSASFGGEIDGFADVRPMRIGDVLSITPANVADATPLYFQSESDESRTAALANFSSVSDLAKLSTQAVTDAEALAALESSTVLASYQLDVLPLVGMNAIDFAVEYELLPGEEYNGNGSDIDLVEWDGNGWTSIAFAFDPVTGRLTLGDWAEPAATLAIVQTESMGPNGDYNGDGQVDAADYVAWRKGAGVPSTEPYYNAWRTNYGTTTGGGAASVIAVPEPTRVVLTLVAGVCADFSVRRRRRAAFSVVR